MSVVAHHQALGIAACADGLFSQLAIGRPGLALLQAVALIAGDLAVQVVALVAEQLLIVDLQGQQMAAAIGQPADPMPVRAGGGETLVEGIVFMFPHRYMRFLQVAQVLMLTGVVARTVVEPLQFAGGVFGEQQVAIAVIGEGFGLPFQAFLVPGMAGNQPPEWVILEFVDPIAVEAAGGLVAAMVVEVVGGLLVEAGFLDQATSRVILEAGGAVVFVAQLDQLTEAVPAVIEGGAVGVLALLDQSGFVVVPGGALAQGVGVREQTAFGVALEDFFGLVGVDQSYQLPGAVFVGGDISFGIGKTAELGQCIVIPVADLARAVGVADQLAVGVVGQLFAATVGIGDEDGQVIAVVGVLGFALQRVDGLDDVAALIVVVPPQAAFGVAGFETLVLIIVGVMNTAAVWAGVLEQVAPVIVGIAVDTAVGVDMADNILGIVPVEPLFVAVRVDDPVGVAEDVVVVPGFLAQRVGHVGQADVLVPLQAGVVGALVGPLAYSLGVDAFALPLQVDTAPGAVGVAGDQVVLIFVVPLRGVFVACSDQVAVLVVVVAGQFALGLAFLH
ncbi:hypothetical protein D3C84_119710 [compost metagenome]